MRKLLIGTVSALSLVSFLAVGEPAQAQTSGTGATEGTTGGTDATTGETGGATSGGCPEGSTDPQCLGQEGATGTDEMDGGAVGDDLGVTGETGGSGGATDGTGGATGGTGGTGGTGSGGATGGTGGSGTGSGSSGGSGG